MTDAPPFPVLDMDGDDVRDRFTWTRTRHAWEGRAREETVVQLQWGPQVFRTEGDVLYCPLPPEAVPPPRPGEDTVDALSDVLATWWETRTGEETYAHQWTTAAERALAAGPDRSV